MEHHSIQVTVDIYRHLVPGGNKAAVDRLDEVSAPSPAIIRNLSATTRLFWLKWQGRLKTKKPLNYQRLTKKPPIGVEPTTY
jgi:hypothetical protein